METLLLKRLKRIFLSSVNYIIPGENGERIPHGTEVLLHTAANRWPLARASRQQGKHLLTESSKPDYKPWIHRFKPAPLLRQESKKLKKLAKWQQNIQPTAVLNLTTSEIPNESFNSASIEANGQMSLSSPVPSPSHCISQTALINKPSTHSAYTNKSAGGKLRMLSVY